MSGEAGMGREKRGKQTLRKKMMVVMLISAMSSILAVVIVSYMTIRMIRNDSNSGKYADISGTDNAGDG